MKLVAPRSMNRAGALALAGAMLALAPAAVPAAPAPESNVTRATLANGLRVVIVRDPLAPVVTEEVNYLVGSQDTPPGFPGMAHAEEHMIAARANKGLTENQLATITTLLGGDFNADTQATITQYYISTPADYLDVALRVEAARMSGALDLQSQWVQERGAIEQEVSSDLSNAFTRYYEKALARVFAGTPYDHEPLGTRASFERTTGAMLRAFFDKWYAPNNAILVIAGDIDPAPTLAHVRAIFGPIAARPVPPQPTIKMSPMKTNGVIRDTSDFPVPFALLTYRMPGYSSPDFAAADVAIDVLSSQRGDLYALTADGKALSTGVEYVPFPAAGLAFAYIATPQGSDTDAALNLVAGVIAKYQKDGVPADLVEAAKRREIAQLDYARNSIEGLADQWSQAIAVQNLASPDDIAARYRSVTVDAVNRVVRTYLVRNKAVAGILTPKPGAVPSGEGGLGVKDVFNPKQTKAEPLPAWAARLNAPPSVPPSIEHPTDELLPNGIRLIVQPESVSPTVIVRGEIDRNAHIQEPPGKEGVDDVLGGLFGYGTTTYDRIAYQTQLDQIAADVNAGGSFSLNVPAASFDRGVQLLADDVLHPALPADDFKIVAEQTAQSLQGEMTSPDYLAQRALLGALLPPGDAALRHATPQTVSALSLDDVKAYHAAVFRPDMTTIVVAGNVTVEQARASVARWFGGWTASGPKPQTDLPPLAPNAPAKKTVSAPGRTQASVTLEEIVGVRRDDPQYYALQLGDAILGGGFYSTRFSRDLRQQNGLVYAISVGVSATRTRASYSVEFGSDPQNVGRARTIIDRDLHDLATKPPSPAEMAQAKTQLMRDLSLSEASVSAIAGGLAGRSVAHVPIDDPQRRARAILTMTAQSVTDAFAKFVDPTRFVQISEGPAPR